MEKLVSIIIPVYNVGKYIHQCIDSVINQTYRHLEILIVDDGSTDLSGRICDEYAERDDRITVYHTENHGLAAARNYAIDRAHGEYIAFLDSDDWIESHAIGRFLDAASYMDADIVACRFYQEFTNTTAQSPGPKGEFIAEGEEILRSVVLEHRISEDVWNKFYKTRLFDAIRYPKGRVFEDYATTYKLLQASSRLAYIPDCLIHYRNRENSLSNNHSMKNLVDYWLVFRERFENLRQISDEYHHAALSDCIGAVSRMWRWYAGCTREEKTAANIRLDEMQDFLKAYRAEILADSRYSVYTKATCQYAMSRSPILFRVLFMMNSLYRRLTMKRYYKDS